METLIALARPNPSFLPIARWPPPRKFPRSAVAAAIRPPPPGFDYRSEVLEESRAAVAARHPELADLAADGTLVLIEKRRFGPVPAWRAEFVEPEAIWLVGTSHVSEESADDVDRVVRALRPDNVVVELCRSRAGIMYASNDAEDSPTLKSNMFSLSGTKFFGTITRSINLGGQTALALRLLLAVFSSKISYGANRLFGDEFRAARLASEAVGAQIVLGDRPIEITLKRVWSSLIWSEKSNLLISLLRGIVSPSFELPKNNLKDQKMGGSDGSPFQLYEKLSITYPSLLQPLIHERDIVLFLNHPKLAVELNSLPQIEQTHVYDSFLLLWKHEYIAWSLKRSKAVNNSKRVVGVIGKAHMNGVVYSLITDLGNLRFRDLVGRTAGDNSNGWITNVIKSLFRDTVLTFILWGLYEQLKDRF